MSLMDRLIDQLETAGIAVSSERRTALDRQASDLLHSYKALLSLQKGETAPDFELPNALGKPIRLTAKLARGPAVVTFYRGQWCPYCSRYLGALERAVGQMRELGAEILAISPQTPDNSLSTAEKLHLSYEVLSDTESHVARRYGLLYVLPEEFRKAYLELGIDLPKYNGNPKFELPIPATYVISPDREILYSFVDADYTNRPLPEAILAVLRES